MMRRVPSWVVGGVVSCVLFVVVIVVYYITGHMNIDDPMFYPIVRISGPAVWVVMMSVLLAAFVPAGSLLESILMPLAIPWVLPVFGVYYFLLGAAVVKIYQGFKK